MKIEINVSEEVVKAAEALGGVVYYCEGGAIVVNDTDVTLVSPSKVPGMTVIETLDQEAGGWF